MKISQKDQQDILDKNKRLESIKPILKSEFIGIDDVIDNIIESIRPFYVFPKSLKRPLVVNLWGLTGTGKTSIVDRIVDLLELNNRYSKFDVGEYSSSNSDWKLKQDLGEATSNIDTKNMIFAFDEFQLGRTINEMGAEVDRIALRPMWEVIDHGIIYEFNYSYSRVFDILKKIKQCADSGVEVKKGYVVKNEHVYNSVFRREELRPCDFKVCTYQEQIEDEDENHNHPDREPPIVVSRSNKITEEAKEIRINKIVDPDSVSSYYFDISDEEMKHFVQPRMIKYYHYCKFYEANPAFFENEFNFKKHIDKFNLPFPLLIEMISKNFIMNSSLMRKKDFSQSLVFCVGNVDEAYTMAFSSDPDADADLFWEHSLKINIPKMKNALSHRFRMEQIGRLGNNHIVYPALNKNSYEKIIELYFNKRVEHFEEQFGIKLEVDESLKDIMYKESVFPSQGVRPILSSFNTLVDSYVSRLISDLIFQNPTCDKVNWKYSRKDEKYIISSTGEKEEVIIEYPVKLNIENLRESDYSENQAFTAVHEAGHAVISVVAADLVPKEVVSKTASIAEGFCRIEYPEQMTRDLSIKQIKVLLAGIESERFLFGDELISSGAFSDLSRATDLAVSMIKEFGMGESLCQIRATTDSTMVGMKVMSEDYEEVIAKMIDDLQKDVQKLLKDNEEFLLELSHFLSNNSKIEKDELTKMAKKYHTKFRDKDHYYDFKDTIKTRMNKIDMSESPDSIVKEQIYEFSQNKKKKNNGNGKSK